jgi:hypothetical protein
VANVDHDHIGAVDHEHGAPVALTNAEAADRCARIAVTLGCRSVGAAAIATSRTRSCSRSFFGTARRSCQKIR